MKTTPIRSFLLALALAAVALPSFAAKTAELLSSWDIVSCTGCLDGKTNFDGGNGAGSRVFNGTFGDYQMQPRASNGATYIIDLSAKAGAPAGGYVVTEIKVDTTGEKAYTLQYTTDGANWTTVDGANSVKAAGIASYSVGALATKVRYVFNNGSPWDYSTEYLAEIQVWGYAPAQPEVLSSWDIVSCTGCLDGKTNFDGGNGAGSRVFNGTFGDYQMQPRASNGATYIIDLSAKENAPAGGYYVTEIKVDTTGEKAYTLQYTTDGSNWTTVDGANSVKASGIASYSVDALATKVRYVFNNGSPWDYSTEYLAEIQVLGMDPADIDCTHPSWTQWTAVPDSATCTTKGVEERFCTTCNERQTKLSDTVAPLGHDYRSHLEQAGTVTAYGSGYVDCSRCDFRIDFSDPVDLTTYGGLAMENLVQFTDISVSSTFHQEWGPNPIKLYDGKWDWDNNVGFWLSSEYEAMSDSHVDYHFGAPVDLTSIDISVHNHNQTLQFYDVDDTTGEERLLVEQVVYENTEEGAPGYQRMKVYAFAGACTHLRLRTVNDDGYRLWGYRACMLVIEMRPYGTIAGANKLDPGKMFLFMQ